MTVNRRHNKGISNEEVTRVQNCKHSIGLKERAPCGAPSKSGAERSLPLLERKLPFPSPKLHAFHRDDIDTNQKEIGNDDLRFGV